MKIRALRVAELGRFIDPIAIEGFGGALDVLAGPNELGKSTLLQALRIALFAKHTSRSSEITDLKPYRGGAPTVEVDLETHEGVWRVRKRFLAQASAELVRPGQPGALRGADAEAALADLIGGADQGQFKLLWVSQADGGTLARSSTDDALVQSRDAIGQALANEIGAVAEGGRVRAVHGEVTRLIAEMVTATGRPKLHGALDVASKSVERLKRERSDAEQRLRLVEQRLGDLARISERRQALSDPATVQRREAAVARSSADLEAGRAAAEKRDRALQALKVAESEKSLKHAATVQLAEIERDLDDAAQRIQAGAAAAETLTGRATELAQSIAEVKSSVAAARTRVEGLGQEHSAALGAERRAAASIRLRELDLRGKEATRIKAESAALQAAVAASGATPGILDAARREQRDIAELDAQLHAAAPTVHVAYVSDTAARFRIGTSDIAEGATLKPTSAMTIEVPGIGTITIAPGRSAALDDIEADLAAHRAQLDDLLARARAPDIAALEDMARRRTEAQSALAHLASRLTVLTPDGSDALQAEIDVLERTIAALPHQTVRSIGEIEPELAEASRDLETRQRALDSLTTALAGAHSELTGHRARLEAATRTRDSLRSKLPKDLDLEAHRMRLQSDLGVADAAVNAAARDWSAWRETAPSEAQLQQLEAVQAHALAATAAAEREMAELQTAAARIEGELATLRNEDVATRVQELSDQLAEAEALLAAVNDELGALRLIDAELASEEAKARGRYLEPVMLRLAPLLRVVFPDADLSLGAQLGPQSLVRGGQSESLERLSDGTREQIAVLTRLGFARLFADTGRSVPVILDDALVYADDGRIERMFRALSCVAKHCQVIVFTCREKAFDGLGGQRLALSPWAPALSLAGGT